MTIERSRNATPRRSRSSTPSRASIRPEIQALRALAVVAVVVYHYWPGVLRGGFVGVDVFFVISGFLITGHLRRSAGRPLGSSILSFWARRARRLLPASLLVLVVTALAVFAVVPKSLWQQFFAELAASALYVQNWLLASNAVDYLAANNTASPAQHYWSLSVEEQFYLVWPVLVLGTLAAVARTRSLAARTSLVTVLGAVALASLGYGIILTSSVPSLAYFATTTRVWEFAAGGILAILVPVTPRAMVGARTAVSWLGLALIVGSAVTFTGATPFPGVAALAPVVGTLAVLWAGSPVAALSPSRLFALRPVQYLGDISYSLYLWHFSLLIVAGYALATSSGLVFKGSLLVGTVILAALTKRFVEDPVRNASFLVAARSRRTFTLVAAGMAVVVAVAGLGWETVQLASEASAREAAAKALHATACFGAAARSTPRPRCAASTPVSQVVPQPDVASLDRPIVYKDGCHVNERDPQMRACVFGKANSKFRVALIGDSHAAEWFPALVALSNQNGWQLTTYLKSSCPFGEGARVTSSVDPSITSSCADWNSQVVSALASAKPFRLVVTTDYENNAQFIDSRGAITSAAAVSAYRAAWKPLVARGARVAVIDDTPHPGSAGAACFTSHLNSPQACDLTPSATMDASNYLSAASAHLPGSFAINLNDYFCSRTSCPAVIGGVFVYRDDSHMTATFARTLAPVLLEALTTNGVPTKDAIGKRG
jgi:peptidoglycan/LPS O-acetylase OafA/YrhL